MVLSPQPGLLTDVSALVAERQSKYGPPIDDFACARGLLDIWEKHRNNSVQLPPKQESAFRHAVGMLFVKISRSAVSPEHGDNWDDINGYVKCIQSFIYHGETKAAENQASAGIVHTEAKKADGGGVLARSTG